MQEGILQGKDLRSGFPISCNLNPRKRRPINHTAPMHPEVCRGFWFLTAQQPALRRSRTPDRFPMCCR